MLGKIILSVLMGTALPVLAQNASVNTGLDSQEKQDVSQEQQTKSDKKDIDTISALDNDETVKSSLETGKDPRMDVLLKNHFKKDVSLGAYETKLIYRQMISNKKQQENKTQTLKQMADAFQYTDEQLQQAEKLYDEGKKPVEYHVPDNEDGSFEKFITDNPEAAMQQLVMSAPMNLDYMSEKMKSSNQSVVAESADQEKAPSAQDVVQQKENTPVRSVISLSNNRQPPVAKQEKRLGVKSYGINPDNFY